MGRILFTLVHFHILPPTIIAHPNYVFPLLEDNTHIVGLALNMLFIFLVVTRGVWSIKTFNAIKEMCSLVSTWVRLVYITFSGFLTFEFGLHILGAPMGFLPFVESFVLEAL